MKFYLDKDGDLLTEKQFKKQYLNEEAALQVLLNGYFQEEFIKVCNASLKLNNITIKEVLNFFIVQLQKNEGLFLEYREYWDVEEKEIDNEKIIEELKDN